MALDMFIKIGDVKGESVDHKHKGDIGGGSGAGKVNVQDISLTKYIDLSSTELALRCCTGKHYDKATLVVRKAGDKPLEYLTITLTEVMITAISTGGSGGEDRLTENVTLNFAKVQVDYKEQLKDGGKGADTTMTWNIAENIKE
jgi:type VI secretion system secreted protein Hcp